MNRKVFFMLVALIIIEIVVGVCIIVQGSKAKDVDKPVVVANSQVVEEEKKVLETPSAEPIVVEISVPEENIIETPSVEPTTGNEMENNTQPENNENKQENIIQKPASSVYYIKVNNQMNTVTIYIQDEYGQYTVPIKAMICSTGEKTFQNSTYRLTSKRWKWQPLFGNVYGQYATQISGNILFHSVPYITNYDPSSLEYWEYDKLGTSASAGCVRLTVEDAKWIYDNCPYGTAVEFYNSEEPGPLGKPTSIKISEYEGYRDWDPTDPNENNPWKNIN